MDSVFSSASIKAALLRREETLRLLVESGKTQAEAEQIVKTNNDRLRLYLDTHRGVIEDSDMNILRSEAMTMALTGFLTAGGTMAVFMLLNPLTKDRFAGLPVYVRLPVRIGILLTPTFLYIRNAKSRAKALRIYLEDKYADEMPPEQ